MIILDPTSMMQQLMAFQENGVHGRPQCIARVILSLALADIFMYS